MSDRRIVILDAETANPGDLSWEDLEGLGEVVIYEDTDHFDDELIIKRLEEAEIALTNKVPLNKYVLKNLPELKYISVLATGVNVVDLSAANQQNIKVSNVPAYSTDSVAQLTFAHLLEITQQVGHHSQEVHRGKWEEHGAWTFYDYPLIELAGKTMGTIGFGDIGQKVGRIAKAFGMNILAYNRSQNEAGRAIASYVSLDDLLAESDVITLHIPLTEETKEIINKESISKMKTDVILLNTARGPLVNETDMARALNEGRIYAAGLDVASSEPIENSNPLLKAKNCFITPHIGWASKESRSRLIQMTVSNVRNYLEGSPAHLVNDSN